MPYNKSTQKKYGDNPLQKKSGFKLRSSNTTSFKDMGGSPVKQRNILDSFRDFLKSKQTPEGRKTGDIKRRMFSPNIEVRMQAQKENRARFKKAREATKTKTKPKHAEMYTFTTPKTTKFKPYEFTRKGDPYSYRTTEGSGYEFKSIGKGGRTKGEWYTATGGLEKIAKAYKKSMGIE